MSNEKCIGTATVAQQENKWVIAVYEQGFDFQSEVDKNKDTATCYVDVVQLNERGFLISTDTEEFAAIPGFGISDNMSGQELLNKILDSAGTTNNTEEWAKIIDVPIRAAEKNNCPFSLGQAERSNHDKKENTANHWRM